MNLARTSQPAAATSLSCELRESVVVNGPSAGCRQLEVRLEDGIDLRILPDRGFDVGQAWWRGRPLGWIDPYRDLPPNPGVSDTEWIRSFSGGLLTTCGLRHIGQPRGRHGLHGRYSHQRARTTSVNLENDGSGTFAAVRGVICEPGDFDALLEVKREIVSYAGVGRLYVSDVVTNLGGSDELVRLLYHLNFIYPSNAGSSVLLNGGSLGDDLVGRAFDTVELIVPQDSCCDLEIRDTIKRSLVKVSWNTERLTKLYVWTASATVGPVFAVELATASLVRPHEQNGEDGVVLAPGEDIELGFSVSVADLAA